jgi:hypothetical protein
MIAFLRRLLRRWERVTRPTRQVNHRPKAWR